MALPSKKWDCDDDSHQLQKIGTPGGTIYAYCQRCDRRFQLDAHGNVIQKTRFRRAKGIIEP